MTYYEYCWIKYNARKKVFDSHFPVALNSVLLTKTLPLMYIHTPKHASEKHKQYRFKEHPDVADLLFSSDFCR